MRKKIFFYTTSFFFHQSMNKKVFKYLTKTFSLKNQFQFKSINENFQEKLFTVQILCKEVSISIMKSCECNWCKNFWSFSLPLYNINYERLQACFRKKKPWAEKYEEKFREYKSFWGFLAVLMDLYIFVVERKSEK